MSGGPRWWLVLLAYLVFCASAGFGIALVALKLTEAAMRALTGQ